MREGGGAPRRVGEWGSNSGISSISGVSGISGISKYFASACGVYCFFRMLRAFLRIRNPESGSRIQI